MLRQYVSVSVAVLFCTVLLIQAGVAEVPGETHAVVLSDVERQALLAAYEDTARKVLPQNSSVAESVGFYSRRGDACFFLGQFLKAVMDYQAMVKLDPSRDASHWRLGIALFFANQPEAAVTQFEKYHSFDDVDRENGIWRYLSQYKARGADVAQKELLRYEKDDREPFPAVYKLFDGSLTAKDALAEIPETLPAREIDKRRFYTELYIGLHLVVQGQDQDAQKYLGQATARNWPRKAGYGPNYMWHVGRVQYELLQRGGE